MSPQPLSAITPATNAIPTAQRARIDRRHLRTLLRDDNWHVRARVLDTIAETVRGDSLVDVAVDVLTDDASWRTCPSHLSVRRERLLVLHRLEGHDPEARQHALFTLLREHHTGAVALPTALLEQLVDEASTSPSWLTSREARYNPDPHGSTATGVVRSAHQTYRRLRDSRALQVALDLPDLERAVAVAEAAARAGAELIEIGDPLMKEFGLRAITAVKQAIPQVIVVAEMMSADWGRDQVVLAAQAGADVAFLIGPASSASVAAAVEAGRRTGVPVVLDVPARHMTEEWVRSMERVGVDGFTVTTNIDLGVAGNHPFTAAERIRSWSRLPIAVSGGFSPTAATRRPATKP